MKKTKADRYTEKEALDFHSDKKPGKIEIISSKNMTTKRDLALAYSPGVAAPVKAISENPEAAYDYTAKGNLVAVISNGSAILGMGNLGALASKPVMEGKAVLFKRFADIDSIDLEIDCNDANEIINSIKNFAPSFGGINLEDIAAPDCFVIEEKLKEILDIPVFHDDQHGTAIITTAALINALHINGKSIKNIKVVVNGAGASAIACTELFKNSGVLNENVIMLDRKGVIYKGRTEGMDQWKSRHAVETKLRTLGDAIEGADVFLGLSAKGALKKEFVKKMAKNPIIFACANPDPEILPEEIEEVRNDAIIATGRSDYPNQVNNLIGFPYIFRGALDVRSKTINEEMKVAAANAIAELAREDVPDEVVAAMGGQRPKYGKDYIIPSTFDPRLISVIPAAVAKAAMDSGVARKPIVDFEVYKDELKKIGYNENFDIEIVNSKDTEKRKKYVQYLFQKLQREKGLLERDCDRLVRNDRVVWAVSMVACGDADGAVTGNTRRFGASFEKITQVVGARNNEIMFGLNMIVFKGKTIFVADTSVHEYPSSEEMSEIAISAARVVRLFGINPKVAFVSHSTFGQPLTSRTKHIKKAVDILKDKNVDFEFDGDMQPDVALNDEYKDLYPFSNIVGNANILIMPGQHSAAISYKMLKTLGDTKVIGPLLIGLGLPIEIAPLRTSISELINLASIAAYSADKIDYKK